MRLAKRFDFHIGFFDLRVQQFDDLKLSLDAPWKAIGVLLQTRPDLSRKPKRRALGQIDKTFSCPRAHRVDHLRARLHEAIAKLQNCADFPAPNRREMNRRNFDSARNLTQCLSIAFVRLHSSVSNPQLTDERRRHYSHIVALVLKQPSNRKRLCAGLENHTALREVG
ncbi:MAG: hypothetical protein AAFY15_11425 [Cyanobacteria bacterium J06648_11]